MHESRNLPGPALVQVGAVPRHGQQRAITWLGVHSVRTDCRLARLASTGEMVRQEGTPWSAQLIEKAPRRVPERCPIAEMQMT